MAIDDEIPATSGRRGLFHPERPFAPRRWPFFYGWVAVAVGTLAVLCSMPGQTNGVSVFTDHLIAATGLDRLQMAIAYFVGTGLSGFLLPSAGRILDALGCRRMAVFAGIALALVLVAMTTVGLAAQGLAALLGDPVLAGLVVMTIGFTLLRFSGQGLLTVVGRTLIGKWFEARRGLISALTGAVIAFGFSFAPAFFQILIDFRDWQTAWLMLAGLVVVLMGGVGWLLARDNPEECGLQMDGGYRAAAKERRIEVRTFHEATRAQALATPAFWAVLLALAGHGSIFTGFAFHVVQLGDEAGLSTAEATRLFMPMAVVAPVVGFAVGILCDHVRIKWLLIAMATAQAVAYIGSLALGASLGWWTAMLGYGVSGGFFGPLSAVALPRFFGRAHLGAINGAQMAGMVFASAVGPLILAIAQDVSGYLYTGFLWSLVIPLAAAVLATFAENPQERWRHQPPA